MEVYVRVVRHYGENIVPPEYAREFLVKMKCCVVIGSSLQVGKIAHFVCPHHEPSRPLLAIVNVDETKMRPDNWARTKGVRLYAKCDLVMKGVAILLGLTYNTNPPPCSRKLVRERGETLLDLKRIFFGERNRTVR